METFALTNYNLKIPIGFRLYTFCVFW